MTKSLTAILAVGLVAVCCSRGVSRRPLPTPNPTTYSFPLPLEEVRTRALQAFSMEHQFHEPVFGRPAAGRVHFATILSAECSTNAVFGEAIFRSPANVHDIYLHSFNSPFAISPVYHGRDGGLPFIATFHLHLTSSGSNTLVTVTASDTEVINGTKFGIGHGGPGRSWNYERVKPTTVEEYSILRYLGRSLGVTNMPVVTLPKK